MRHRFALAALSSWTACGEDVVVTIRHPAAFAASVLRLGWRHDFGSFAGDERLHRFEAELQRPGDALEHAARLWRILYSIVDDYRGLHPGWMFVRHEDAARAPLETFSELYTRLELELTPQARRRIERASASRRLGLASATCASNAVSVGPGLTQLTRIP